MGMTSFRILQDNPKLLLFPIFSSLSLLTVMGTFLGGMAIISGLDYSSWMEDASVLQYLLLFGFYLLNYFVIVFFNVGLVYCAKRIFEGHEVTLTEGLNFSYSRIGVILQWAALAATVGVILRTLQENLGWVGKIIVGLIGMVWSIATYFVVPVLAFEGLAPIAAVKRSGNLIKEKWGESLSANVGFGVFYLVGYLVIFISGFLMGYVLHPVVGIVLAVLAILVLHIVVSAAQTVFLAAAYQRVNDEPFGDFSGEVLDGMFVRK